MRFSHSKRCSRPHFPIIFSGNELDFYLSDICTYNFSFDKSRKTIFAFKSESLICLWIKPRKIRFQFASFVLEKRAQISLHNCFGFENPPENLLNDFDMLCKQFSCQANTINCFHETDKSIEIPSEIDVIQPHQLTLISAWFNKSYKNLCRHRLNIIINYLMQLTIVCLSVCHIVAWFVLGESGVFEPIVQFSMHNPDSKSLFECHSKFCNSDNK